MPQGFERASSKVKENALCMLFKGEFLFPLQSSPLKVVYKNNDVRLELSRLAKQGDPKMKVSTT